MASVHANSTGYVLLTAANIPAANQSSSQSVPAVIVSMKQKIKTAVSRITQ